MLMILCSQGYPNGLEDALHLGWLMAVFLAFGWDVPVWWFSWWYIFLDFCAELPPYFQGVLFAEFPMILVYWQQGLNRLYRFGYLSISLTSCYQLCFIYTKFFGGEILICVNRRIGYNYLFWCWYPTLHVTQLLWKVRCQKINTLFGLKNWLEIIISLSIPYWLH